MGSPKLSELCIQQCIRHSSLIEDIGYLPYYLVKPILAKLAPEQLANVELKSPHLTPNTEEIWKEHIITKFKDRKVPPSNFKQTFFKYCQDKEDQLGQARERLKMKQQEYSKNKRASAVVALSESELPLSQRGPPQQSFKSRTMQSVARRIQPKPRPMQRIQRTPINNFHKPAFFTHQPTNIAAGHRSTAPTPSTANTSTSAPTTTPTAISSTSAPTSTNTQPPSQLNLKRLHPQTSPLRRKKVSPLFHQRR